MKPMLAEIDLGDIAQGGQKQQAFQLRNDSGSFVEVAVIEMSCSCARIRLERTDIPPGERLLGWVYLDLRQKPDFVGDLAIEAKGLTQRGQVAFVLVIRAQVLSASKTDMGTL